VELSHDDPRAYIQLADRLRCQVLGETLTPGSPVPSITTLSQQYGHARQTCSRALRLLIDDGLLFRVPGLGYHVAKDARALMSGGRVSAVVLAAAADTPVGSVGRDDTYLLLATHSQ
jgi:GntR family transcriptional regulator